MSLQRVLYFTQFPPQQTGAHATNLELVTAVAAGGFEVEVVTEPWDGDEKFDVACRRDHGVSVHRLPEMLTLACDCPPQEERRFLTEYLVRFLKVKQEAGTMPDMVVIGHDKYVWYIGTFKKFGLPVVQHLMGTPMNRILQNLFSGEDARGYLDSLAEADHIVCIAHHFKDLSLRTVPNCTEDKVSVIYSELDTTHFAPGPADPGLRKELELPSDAKVIVHASYFTLVKRIRDIVASAKQIVETRREVYYLILGGDTLYVDDSRVEKVASLIEASGCASHFRMPGIISTEQLPGYLRQGDIFMLTSKAEGLPRVVMEAQACGLYIIASDCAAGKEMTANGTLGSTYPTGDVDALTDTTLRVLDMDPETFDRIRLAGRAVAIKQYSLGVQMTRYVALLNRVYQASTSIGRQRVRAYDGHFPAVNSRGKKSSQRNLR